MRSFFDWTKVRQTEHRSIQRRRIGDIQEPEWTAERKDQESSTEGIQRQGIRYYHSMQYEDSRLS